MGQDTETRIGGINKGPFETVPKNYSWSDHESLDVEVVGDFTELWKRQLRPGMQASSAGVDAALNWFIRTVGISREDCNVGVMRLNLVYCASGITKPFSVTLEVGMEEVQKDLITHPYLFRGKKGAVMKEIRGWERYRSISAKATQTDKDGNTSFYYTTDGSDEAEVKTEEAIAYCKAKSAGIETYNRYLPVVTRTSQYLKLPGATYDLSSNQITGGTIECNDGIGTFDDPPVKVSGMSKGKWFKSRDTFATQADGSATRVEQWTYTDDTDHSWIYDELNGK